MNSLRCNATVREDVWLVTLLSTIRCDTRHVKPKRSCADQVETDEVTQAVSARILLNCRNTSSDRVDDDVREEGGQAVGLVPC